MFCLWNMLEQKPDMLRLWHGHSSCPKLYQLLILKVLNMKWAESLTSPPCCSVITKLIEFWEISSCILSCVKSTKQPLQSQSPWGLPLLCLTGWSWSTRIIFIGMERFSTHRAQAPHKIHRSFLFWNLALHWLLPAGQIDILAWGLL